MVRCLGLVVLTGVLLSCTRFQPKPLSAAGNLEAFEQRTLDAAALKAFLDANRPTSEWPPKSMGSELAAVGGQVWRQISANGQINDDF